MQIASQTRGVIKNKATEVNHGSFILLKKNEVTFYLLPKTLCEIL